MISLAKCDRLGFVSHYYRTDRDHLAAGDHARTVQSLFAAHRELSRALSRRGLLGYLKRTPDGEATCFSAVNRVPAGTELVLDDGACRIRPFPPLSPPDGHLLDLLTGALATTLGSGRSIALALSGGLDSALLAALLRRLGTHRVPAYVLAARLPGYCEVADALSTARSLGFGDRDLVIVEADESAFVDALPATIRAAEVPLFNLHPVSKLLLAERLKEDGIEVVITGDGADQVFAGAPAANYIPIVGALFRAAGVELCTPFATEEIMACAAGLEIDVHKTALRRASAGLVPDRLLKRKKMPRLTPAITVDRHFRPDVAARVARELDLPPPSLNTDHERVLWTTIGLLVETILEGQPCAESPAS